MGVNGNGPDQPSSSAFAHLTPDAVNAPLTLRNCYSLIVKFRFGHERPREPRELAMARPEQGFAVSQKKIAAVQGRPENAARMASPITARNDRIAAAAPVSQQPATPGLWRWPGPGNDGITIRARHARRALRRKKCQPACKPGSVSGRAAWRPFLWDGPCGPPLATYPNDWPGERPAVGRNPTPRRSYSVLLPVGFTMPPPLPAPRWALTPPFHPYPADTAARCLVTLVTTSRTVGGAVCFLWHFP